MIVKRTQKAFIERGEKMVQMYKDGKTLQEIADEVGVCRERVRQIMERIGVPRRRKKGERLALTSKKMLDNSTSEAYNMLLNEANSRIQELSLALRKAQQVHLTYKRHMSNRIQELKNKIRSNNGR